jgi:RNA polymerase sigma factor (sigma-70 family)
MTKPALASVLNHLCCIAETSRDARLTDRQLLERYLTCREEAAFAALVRRHGCLVLSACRRVLTEEADVEDAFQATFLVLLRKASLVRWQESIGNWLFGVAHRISVQARANALRRRCRESETILLRQRSDGESPELSWREALALLHEELNRLPDKYRLPLLLCYLEGKTREETAQLLNCSAGSIKGRLERGRVLLRNRLIRRGVALSNALLAAAVDAPTVRSVTPSLVLATLAAAKHGAYRSSVAALMKTAVPALWPSKMRLVVGVLLTVGLLGVGGRSALAPLSATPEPPAPRPAERRQPPPLAQAKAKDTIIYKGRVLGPDEKPIAGAKVYYYFLTYQEEAIPVRAITDAEGRFSFALTPKDIPLSADAAQADPRKWGHVVVKADGFTFAWSRDPDKQTDFSLHVAADDSPLTGRIIDLQGKPIAGLHVTAWSVASPAKGDLTPFVKALQSRETFYTALRTHVPNALQSPYYWRPRTPLLPATTTDADGRFRLHGFAREQLVELRIEGSAVETQNVFVMTRPAPREGSALLSTPRIKDPIFGPSEKMVVLSNGFDHPLPPGLTVAGTVRDAESKRPIPRAIVESYMLAGSRLGQNTIYHTVSDEQGRYRFTGLPRGKGNRIRIRPPADQPYIPQVKEVPDVKLFEEADVDVDLPRGVWVDVTVADKSTGLPVPGHVSYFVLPEKPSPERPFEHPFADSYNNFMAVRNDGTFRFVAVPRRAILSFRADREKYPIAREAATIHFPFGLSASNFQAFATINPKPDDEPVKVKFVLDAGHIVKGKILDPEGHPMSGALAAGLRHDWYWGPDMPMKSAEFTALGISPDRPRLLCFVHEAKKLAGSVVVRGDEKHPVEVKLKPWATVSGRLLDANGKPIANASLRFTEIPVRKPDQPMSLDTGLHVITRWAGKPSLDPHTDDQGRFRIERLVPGLKYNLALVEEQGAIRFEQIKWPGLVFSNLILKAGEVKELGDVKLQPFPNRDREGARKATAP